MLTESLSIQLYARKASLELLVQPARRAIRETDLNTLSRSMYLIPAFGMADTKPVDIIDIVDKYWRS